MRTNSPLGAGIGEAGSLGGIDGDGTTADNGTTITSGNTIASKSTDASTTPSGGFMPYNTGFSTGGDSNMDLTGLDLFIAPGEVLSVSAVGSGAVDSFLVTLNWVDDI